MYVLTLYVFGLFYALNGNEEAGGEAGSSLDS